MWLLEGVVQVGRGSGAAGGPSTMSPDLPHPQAQKHLPHPRSVSPGGEHVNG